MIWENFLKIWFELKLVFRYLTTPTFSKIKITNWTHSQLCSTLKTFSDAQAEQKLDYCKLTVISQFISYGQNLAGCCNSIRSELAVAFRLQTFIWRSNWSKIYPSSTDNLGITVPKWTFYVPSKSFFLTKNLRGYNFWI